MGHLIEEYAKTLGVKIGKPVLVEHFYPILDDKYITIHTDSKIDSKNYEYFPQVLNFILPILHKNGYKVYQIGGPEDPKLDNVDGCFLNLSYKQSCYLIKNSSLHVGIDSLPVHIASNYNVPIVVLYSHIYASNAYPFWSDKDKVKILQADRKGLKPSFDYKESPKCIRNIYPETVAQNIFDLLNLNIHINFNTLYIGGHYHIPFVEIVPNFKANLEDQKNKILYIRGDLHFDEDHIAFWCANYKVRLITNSVVSLELLHHFRDNIDHVFFKISDTNIPTEYFDNLKKLKIKYTICCLVEEKLSEIRNFYFENIVEMDNEKQRVKDQKRFLGKFNSNKIILSNLKVYPSEAHMKIDKSLDTVNEVLYDDDTFWKDAEHFHIYE
jgi:hypothetical protein